MGSTTNKIRQSARLSRSAVVGKHRSLPILALLLALAAAPAPAISDYSSSIRLAVDYWLANQKPSGLLPYGFDLLMDQVSEPDGLSTVNLTRQVYTASVLADYYLSTRDPRARPALESFLSAFRDHSLAIGKGRLQRLVEQTHLLSMPLGRYKIHHGLQRLGLLFDEQGPGRVLSPDGSYDQAYTGAGALALLTELRYAQASGDTRFADLRQAWLEGLLALRIPGRGFRQSPTSIDSAPYSDGQAWLALAEYHRRFPQDRRVGEVLADVDDSLIDVYGREYRYMFYHWGTMAAAARYAETRDAKFLKLIKFQTEAFLGYSKETGDNDCASAEGMADALIVLRNAGEADSGLAGKVRAWLAQDMAKAEALQIRPGRDELRFTNAKLVAPRLKEYAGSFLAGRSELTTQIDYTAHCVSAMLKLQRGKEAAPKE